MVDAVRASGPLWAATVIADRVAPVRLAASWPGRVVPIEIVASQLDAILRAWGLNEEHTAITVRHLLYADLHGIDSHGCAMMRSYDRTLATGEWTPTAAIEVVRESETTAVVDGGGGLGHPPADLAMRLAIAKGRAAGLAAVVVRNSGHFGAAGAYAAMAAEAGLLSIVTSSTPNPAVVPTFGMDPKLGTNPLAFGAPAARNEPFLLDMATSTASVGALMAAWRRGEDIPAGWATDEAGAPVTDGRAAVLGRRLTPLGGARETGGHKGYGLTVVTEILSRILAGPPAEPAPAAKPVEHFFLVLDPGRFRDAGGFESDLDALMDSLRATRPRDASRPVLVPGDPEHDSASARRGRGIPLTRIVVEDLRRVAWNARAPFLLDPPRA